MTQQFYPQQGHNSTFPALHPSTDAISIYSGRTGRISRPMADLIFLQATGNYCWLYWKDGQRILTPRTLKYYQAQLSDVWFARLHRNCIVNIQYIERIEQFSPDKGGLVHLRSGAVLPVSRRRWMSVKRLYGRLRA